jgi:beta-aspartyl-dipeptidase (metallo-type)
MLTLIKNAQVFTPQFIGKQDLLVAQGRIAAMSTSLDFNIRDLETIDLQGAYLTPGLIDQHIHIVGAGGKDGFLSMTPEIQAAELIACGTTTAVGLLGTDGTAKNIRALYAKVQSLRQEGLSAYMYSGYYGLDTLTITESIQSDMVFIEPVLGFKIAISDIRSSYPTALELVRKLREVRVGGLLSNKKGIMHVHLGNLPTQMDVLFELVRDFQFPIAHISPTHVGRTQALFDQAIEFALLGGSIDITTGASKYTDPHQSVLYALEKNVPIDLLTFSSDGHAGLSPSLQAGANQFVKAPFDQNLHEVIQLIKTGSVSAGHAFQLITSNPADNLGLKTKGRIGIGMDADLCVFDSEWGLQRVIANGNSVMKDGKVLIGSVFA